MSNAYSRMKEIQIELFVKVSIIQCFIKQLLFRLRSKTLDVKQNFSGQHKNLWCISCGLFPESQRHRLQCPQLVINLKYLTGKASKLNENFIYGNIHQQEMIVNIYSDILEVELETGKSKLGNENLPL